MEARRQSVGGYILLFPVEQENTGVRPRLKSKLSRLELFDWRNNTICSQHGMSPSRRLLQITETILAVVAGDLHFARGSTGCGETFISKESMLAH